MPVVSSTSPPESHGVGSINSVMCTQRTGISNPHSPASTLTSSPQSRSPTVSTARSSSPSQHLHPLPGLGQHRAQDGLDLRELLRAGDQRRRELDHRIPAIIGAADQPAAVELAGEEAAQQRLGFLVVERLLVS